MNHSNQKFRWKHVTPFNELTFNKEWARDPSKLSYLYKFAQTFHSNLTSDEEWDEFYDMILETIKRGNIHGLSLLWDSIYVNRDSPCYEWCLDKAARHGNLKMFQHCLYGFGNYTSINGTEPMNYEDLIKAANDPEVLAYLKRLQPCVMDGKLYPMRNIHEGEWDVEMQDHEKEDEFYKKCKLYQSLSQTE